MAESFSSANALTTEAQGLLCSLPSSTLLPVDPTDDDAQILLGGAVFTWRAPCRYHDDWQLTIVRPTLRRFCCQSDSSCVLEPGAVPPTRLLVFPNKLLCTPQPRSTVSKEDGRHKWQHTSSRTTGATHVEDLGTTKENVGTDAQCNMLDYRLQLGVSHD